MRGTSAVNLCLRHSTASAFLGAGLGICWTLLTRRLGLASGRTGGALLLVAVKQKGGKQQIWRPSLDDVQRISTGDAARHRGTGSRAVPHRLNADERALFDIARKKGVLTVGGTAYRRERKGSPLANLWRQWCDANALPCVVVCKGPTAASGDTVFVDLSTLRMHDVSKHVQVCHVIGQQHGCLPLDSAMHQCPFTTVVPAELVSTMPEEGIGAIGSSEAVQRARGSAVRVGVNSTQDTSTRTSSDSSNSGTSGSSRSNVSSITDDGLERKNAAMLVGTVDSTVSLASPTLSLPQVHISSTDSQIQLSSRSPGAGISCSPPTNGPQQSSQVDGSWGEATSDMVTEVATFAGLDHKPLGYAAPASGVASAEQSSALTPANGPDSAEQCPTLAVLDKLRASAAIWQHPPQLQVFKADRNSAKVLAMKLIQQFTRMANQTP